MGDTSVQPGRQRKRGSVVSGRVSGDVPFDAVFPQAGQRIAGAAELEGAGALQILALAEQLASQRAVQRGIVQYGRLANVAADAGVRQVHVLQIGDVHGNFGIRAVRLMLLHNSYNTIPSSPVASR